MHDQSVFPTTFETGLMVGPGEQSTFDISKTVVGSIGKIKICSIKLINTMN